jgi:hypothetical protein
MADVKISELTQQTPVSTAAVVPLVQSGATRKATVADIGTAILSPAKLIALGVLNV